MEKLIQSVIHMNDGRSQNCDESFLACFASNHLLGD